MAVGGNRAFRVINTVVAVMFLISAVLQYNDPDPLAWVLIYGAAAAACLLLGRASWSWALAGMVALGSLVWAATMISGLRGLVFADLFESMKAETPTIEEGRELLGLTLIGGWMIVLAIVSRPGRQGAR